MRLSARRRAAMIAAGALTVAGIAVPVGSAYAATACDVVYATNDWPGGFTANVTISNLGDPITGWTLGSTSPPASGSPRAGRPTGRQSGSQPSPRPACRGTARSRPAARRASASTAAGPAATPSPPRSPINGVTCGGAPQPQPPTVDLTRAGRSVRGARRRHAQRRPRATPTAPISKVEFYRNGLLVNTDTSAPYGYTLEDLPAGILHGAGAGVRQRERSPPPTRRASPSPRRPARRSSPPRRRSRVTEGGTAPVTLRAQRRAVRAA